MKLPIVLAAVLLATTATAAPARKPDETYGAQPPIDTWVTCDNGPCEPPLPEVKARATPAPVQRDPGLAPPGGQPPIDTWVHCDGPCEPPMKYTPVPFPSHRTRLTKANA